MQPRNGEPTPLVPANAARPVPPLFALLDRMGRRDALQIGLILTSLIAAFVLGYLVGINR